MGYETGKGRSYDRNEMLGNKYSTQPLKFDYESYSLAATGIFKKQKSAVYTGQYVLVVRDCEIHLVPISQIIAGNYE